ncbi:RNA polymerase Rpb1, domain 5 [Dillenia turbinata]|uniref:DNA-directed RNA polymerase subunit n=1 Tax=Dillenia turbinata TaxID=194707 RepID=A0AAN8VTT0_9MAGN
MNRFQEGMVFTKEPYVEDVGPRRIKSIQFSMLSESEIRKMSEVEVWRGLYYDSSKKPVENGLLDPHLGPPNKHGVCATCNGDFTDCPGHYGNFSLALPVHNPGYFNTVIEILRCICKSCSRVLLTEEQRKHYLKRMRKQNLEALKKSELAKEIVKKCNATTNNNKLFECLRCKYMNGNVKKAPNMGITVTHDYQKVLNENLDEFDGAVSRTQESKASIRVQGILNCRRVLSLFKKMSDEDCELLGLCDRPEKFIVTNILVPPTAVRPSVFTDGGARSNENDITERLRRIIHANASLCQELRETRIATNLMDRWDHLQMEVAQYINSDVRGFTLALPGNQERPLSGFVQRLKGKQGRFRGNLSGKRVEYTGRTVISPDPNLKITEVGVPILMAQILTYPERVTPQNIEKLRQCVRNGPNKYPGAKLVTGHDGHLRHLQTSVRKRIANELKYGHIVERHLEDGDVVLFNRQPSLHRMSIMCHRARVMPWRTLRFNESVCNPYNADFDGDEMNMHVPQTEEARTEALLLMGVQNNLCTPKNGEILVASTQDFLTTSFLVTRKDTFYDRAAFSLMCSYMGDGMDPVDLPTPALIKPLELWTGKQLFSVLVRPHARVRVYLNLTVTEKNFTKKDGKGGLDESMCPNDGFVCFRNSELICGQLGKATLGNGNKDGLYSVLLRDYNTHAAAACMNRLAKLSARWIGNHGFSIGIDDVQPGETLNNEKKAKISEEYQNCDHLIQSYNEGSLPLEAGCDAAQTLEAKITGVLNKIREETAKVCMKQLHWRNSPLIMSQCGSKGSPINISQMVACVGQQSVGGRRAPNGFIDRSLPHFPKRSKTPDAKGFVANSFYSGLTATEFFFHTMGGREGLVDTAVKTADTGYMSRRLMKSLEDLYVHYDDTVRNASGGIVQFLYGDDAMDPAKMEGKKGAPLNFDRLYLKVKATCPAAGHANLSSSEISDVIDERFSRSDMTTDGGCSDAFKKSLEVFMHSCINKQENTRKALGLDEKLVNSKGPEVLEKVAANISGFTSKQLQVFLECCISRYHLKRIEAGTGIGAIGAQSIGEPGTQMTLKTFHFAGVASMNVTLGVPRIKEIINAAKKISTPIITAVLDRSDDRKAAEVVKGRIERTLLGQVAKSIKIVMTSRIASIFIKLDGEKIRASQQSITADDVRRSILETKKLKPKQLDIKVLDDKLEVIPLVEKSRLHFVLHFLKNALPTVGLKGIKTVQRAVVSSIKGKDKKENHKLLVEGTGLLEVMGIEGVNGRETSSNHVMEVLQTLGIEAARRCIIDEIQYTMSSHGMSIDIRHMMLLADIMTFKGEVLGITRFGIQKMKDSVLMLASFERTADHLFNASVTGRNDRIEGVSECIIMGMPMQIGTGILKVRQRVERVPELKYAPDPILSWDSGRKI